MSFCFFVCLCLAQPYGEVLKERRHHRNEVQFTRNSAIMFSRSLLLFQGNPSSCAFEYKTGTHWMYRLPFKGQCSASAPTTSRSTSCGWDFSLPLSRLVRSVEVCFPKASFTLRRERHGRIDTQKKGMVGRESICRMQGLRVLLGIFARIQCC